MATLIDVATPGPALATAQGVGGTLLYPNANVKPWGATTETSTPGTYYALNSIALGAGTWSISGVITNALGTYACLLAVASSAGSGTSLGSVVQAGAVGTSPYMVSYGAVIKLAAPTTVYLNIESAFDITNWQGLIYATRIA
jgi:hypothetical protein